MPENSSVAFSVIVTVHGEGRLLRPTLRSVDAAIRYAGEQSELLIVCDTADDATRHEAQRWRSLPDLPYAVRIEETAFGESGAARNAGVQSARGEILSLVDGDDLVSEDYFAAGIATVKSSTRPVIAHPEYMLSFGKKSLLWRTDSMERGGFDYRDMLRHNLWPSSSVGRRDTYLAHPYRSLPPGEGYGPEDWIWNIETVIAGVAHEPAPGSMFFYRLRESGGVNNRHANSVLPPFDIEGLRRALPSADGPYTVASPTLRRQSPMRAAARNTAKTVYKAVLPVARKITSRWSPELRTVVYRTARGGRGLLLPRTPTESRLTLTPDLIAHLHAAAEMEPSISWAAHLIDELPVWQPRDDGFGRILDRALLELGDVDALVTVPWVGVGGADLVSLNYARALQATPAFAGKTAFLGTYLQDRTKRDLIPDDITYVHLDERWMRMHVDLQPRLLPQLIALLDPKLIVSVNCFHLTTAMRDHHRPIVHGRRVFATLFAFDRIGAGLPVNPITDDNQRRYLDAIDGIITDNTTTTALIGDILALEPPRVLTHRQPVAEEVPELPRDTSAYTDTTFSAARPFRLVWPHRLDEEKRPDVVATLGRALRARGLPAVIDVWGQRVLTEKGENLLKDLADAGVVYRGPYSGGLFQLPTHEYHALLLTSQSEGLPLVLVQSLLQGLPVIASGVGGVPDIILDGETGLLTSSPDDIEGYLAAIERLISSRDERRAIIERGYAFAAEKHSWKAFERTVAETILP